MKSVIKLYEKYMRNAKWLLFWHVCVCVHVHKAVPHLSPTCQKKVRSPAFKQIRLPWEFSVIIINVSATFLARCQPCVNESQLFISPTDLLQLYPAKCLFLVAFGK